MQKAISRIIGIGVVTLLVSTSIVSPAAAYVDPSVMTYAIQAIAGVVIVVGVSVGVIWRRFKKKAAKVLHIDENAGKEVEADVVAVNPENEETK